MRSYRIYGVPVTLVIVLVILVSCSSSYLFPQVTTEKRTAYLPYVEDVIFPSEIRENDPFVVELVLSSVFEPDLLRGVVDPTIERVSWIKRLQGFRIDLVTSYPNGSETIYPWIVDPTYSGEIRDSIRFTIPGKMAGTSILNVMSASSKEYGGLSAEYLDTDHLESIPRHEHSVYQEYEFTVLPAEE